MPSGVLKEACSLIYDTSALPFEQMSIRIYF